MSKRIKIGEVGVDAGIIWIGDPCYIHADAGEQKIPNEWGRTWADFCNVLHKRSEGGSAQFNYDHGTPGLGVCVDAGYGDGVYPVYAEYQDGRVKSVTIDFMEDDICDD